MSAPPLRIGTRGSDLALWQARRVARLIEERLGRASTLVIVETSGDADRTTPLSGMGGAGAFTKELERALLEGRVDLAVHSLKDLPTRLPDGLALAAVPERHVTADALVAPVPLERLPEGARVGTSSRRRRALLLEMRPDLRCVEIRGNVPTRVEKVRRGEVDATVLAAAGLERLGLALEGRAARHDLDEARFVCAPGQGALAIETRAEDAHVLAPLHDAAAGAEVAAERELLRLVEGGCSVPLGARARREEDGRIRLAAVLAEDGGGRAERPRLRRALVRAETPEGAARMAFGVLVPGGREGRVGGAGAGVGGGGGEGGGETALRGVRVVVTREEGALVERLREEGAEVRVAAAIETVAVEPRTEVPACAWALVTSARAAPLLEGAALGRVGAVGAASAEALARAGVCVDLLAEEASGAGLAEAFIALGVERGTRVLLPGAKEPRPELRERLAAAGFEPVPLALYETRPLAPDLSGAEVVVLASPSAVRACEGAIAALPSSARMVAIGETTASALRERGLGARTHVAAYPSEGGIVDACAEAARALGRERG